MNNKFKRAFIFGCSYTKWNYPTWADMLQDQVDFPVYNFGAPGTGNVGILHSMVKINLKYQFTKHDLIIVGWTFWTREDRYINGQWTRTGNVLTNPYYDKSFVNKYWSFDNDIIKNSTAIILANQVFQINYQFSVCPFGAFDETIDLKDKNSEILNFYIPNLPKCDIFFTFNNQRFHPSNLDRHPDILCHMDFFNQNVAKTLNLTQLAPDSRFKKYQNKISNELALLNKSSISPDEFTTLIKKKFPYKPHSFYSDSNWELNS